MSEVISEIIPLSHWQTRGTVEHARGLLGKYLVRTVARKVSAHMITEVEAYDGERDLACHAAKGRTARTTVLYGPGGHWYVYLCYGIHEMLNLVVGPPDWPAAVLIRGVYDITGPGRLTRRLGIGRELNTRQAAPETGLHIENREVRVPARLIQATPRIGVDYAGPVWAGKPWRFTFDAAALPRRS